MTLKARVAELEIALTEIHAALEWLARTRNLGGCPIEWSVYPVPCDETGECPYPIEDQSDCWLQTALLKVSRRSIQHLVALGLVPADIAEAIESMHRDGIAPEHAHAEADTLRRALTIMGAKLAADGYCGGWLPEPTPDEARAALNVRTALAAAEEELATSRTDCA